MKENKKNCYEKELINNFVLKSDPSDIIIKKAIGKYDKLVNPTNRYSLTIELETKLDKNTIPSTLTVMLFNPSEHLIDLTQNGKKTFIDGTITNVIKIANRCNYSKIIVWNLFSKINSSPKLINKNPEKYVKECNEKELDKILKEDNDVLIAWGGILKKETQKLTKIKRKICDQAKGRLKYFEWNQNTPTHPCSRPYNQKKVNKFLKENDKLKPLEEKYICPN